MGEEEVIQFLIEVAPDVKFLGFQNRGYPLGYRERQKEMTNMVLFLCTYLICQILYLEVQEFLRHT